MATSSAICLSGTSTASSDESKPNKLREGFVSLAETLLASISDVFPECSNTQSVLLLFRTAIKGNESAEDRFVRRCHSLFKENAEALTARESEALFNVVEGLQYVKDVNLREKWEDPDFGQESRDHLWQYISALKTYAELYTAVPAPVMGKIENLAGSLSQQLTRGELDLTNMDLGSIGQGLLQELSPEELASFEGNLPEIYASLSQACGSFSGGGAGLDVEGLMSQLAAQSGENAGSPAGKIDMTQVLQQLQSAAPSEPGGAGVPNLNSVMQLLGPMVQSIQNASGKPLPEGRMQAQMGGPKKRKAR